MIICLFLMTSHSLPAVPPPDQGGAAHTLGITGLEKWISGRIWGSNVNSQKTGAWWMNLHVTAWQTFNLLMGAQICLKYIQSRAVEWSRVVIISTHCSRSCLLVPLLHLWPTTTLLHSPLFVILSFSQSLTFWFRRQKNKKDTQVRVCSVVDDHS